MATDLLILEAGFRVGMTTLVVAIFVTGMVAGWAARSYLKTHGFR